MISFLNFKDFKYYLPINQQPKFEDRVKENNNNNCVINIVDITTLNSVLYSLNGLNNFNQNNVMIYKLSRPHLMGSTGNLCKLNDYEFNSQNQIHYENIFKFRYKYFWI